MRYLILVISLIVITPFASNVQTIDVNKWAIHIVDSLQKNKVDTIEYYHEYCGECDVTRPPGDTTHHHTCEIKYSWVEITNIVIYKQKGRFYSLIFDCNYPPIKVELSKAASLDFFISILPVLNQRDKILKARQKKHFFPPPIVVDGGYQQATLYLWGKRQSAYTHDDDLQKNSPFWLKDEIRLQQLIGVDLKSKLPTAPQ